MGLVSEQAVNRTRLLGRLTVSRRVGYDDRAFRADGPILLLRRFNRRISVCWRQSNYPLRFDRGALVAKDLSVPMRSKGAVQPKVGMEAILWVDRL